jgi:hypothetical protein
MYRRMPVLMMGMEVGKNQRRMVNLRLRMRVVTVMGFRGMYQSLLEALRMGALKERTVECVHVVEIRTRRSMTMKG